VERTGSTNEDAAALLGDDASLGTTIVAEEQTHGAGRKGRVWIARRGTALLFTTILPREISAATLWAVPFWTGLAVRSALLASGIKGDLQWPNDVLLDGKKLAGILCVSRVTGERARVACGVGINVTRASGADRGIDPPPAFCNDVASIERASLLERILLRFAADLHSLDDPRGLATRWEREAGLPGRRYRIAHDRNKDAYDVTAISLAPDGGLIVEHNGRRETVSLADARVLR
jgi:BirA family transcriptional regulator, biotin operon repressor / biotin---[acetyl-CoA-carboxylase] ligase